ncbi:MAG: aminoglycoside phosphotransferase family protein [Oscillospiraceae bacterium]|nr:aminoglycoside phosphotransferase family protein [Oscillospiraceae bacterium]
MYSNVIRDDEYKRRLVEFIGIEYGIDVVGISAARRGFYGETWRIEADSKKYFLKLVYCDEHKGVYERSFPVVKFICDHGIDYISKIVSTKDGKLSVLFDGAVIGIFDWIEGENTETDLTKTPEYQMLARIYTIPCENLLIEKEEFSDKCADDFYELWRKQENTQILSLLEANKKKLVHRAEKLKIYSGICKKDMSGFVITHGDAGGNFITGNGKNYIVDWDGVTHAPPERDAWVMCSRGWARELFQKTLDDNNIMYKLRTERLVYYCYRFFFFYLNSLLTACSDTKEIENFIDCWIEDSIKWAEKQA